MIILYPCRVSYQVSSIVIIGSHVHLKLEHGNVLHEAELFRVRLIIVHFAQPHATLKSLDLASKRIYQHTK